MNRIQAEHILDAYVRMRAWDDDASDALREVILDVMATDYKATITWPNSYGITAPNVISNKPTCVTSNCGKAVGK